MFLLRPIHYNAATHGNGCNLHRSPPRDDPPSRYHSSISRLFVSRLYHRSRLFGLLLLLLFLLVLLLLLLLLQVLVLPLSLPPLLGEELI